MKNRYNFKKTITIRANVNEKIITGLEGNMKVKELFADVSQQYPDVSMVFGGARENAAESFARFSIAMSFALGHVLCVVFKFFIMRCFTALCITSPRVISSRL